MAKLVCVSRPYLLLCSLLQLRSRQPPDLLSAPVCAQLVLTAVKLVQQGWSRKVARAALLLAYDAAKQVGAPFELMSPSVVQEWCMTQLELARQQAPGPESVCCLLPRSPSLEQAGGLHRMVLRGHTGGIMKVLLTSGGIDVITGEGAEAQQRACTGENLLGRR